MKLILLGLALWIIPHYFKRLAPTFHAKAGQSAKVVVALASFIAIFLMVRGYSAWDSTVYWNAPVWLHYLAIPLMFFAVYLFVASGAKTRVTKGMHHPQLTAAMIWAGVHLVLSGTASGMVLFGGMFAWASGQKWLINRREKTWTPAKVWPFTGESRALIVAAVTFAIVVVVHGWVGPMVFAVG